MCDPHIEHVDEYLALAEAAGAGIGHVFETHVQADHLSGALEGGVRRLYDRRPAAAAGGVRPHPAGQPGARARPRWLTARPASGRGRLESACLRPGIVRPREILDLRRAFTRPVARWALAASRS